jgi:hypothetical protein
MTSESYISLAAFSTTLLGKGVFAHRPIKSNVANASVNGQLTGGAGKSSLPHFLPSSTTTHAACSPITRSRTEHARSARSRMAAGLLSVRKNIALKGVTRSLWLRKVFSKTSSLFLSITSDLSITSEPLRSLELRG